MSKLVFICCKWEAELQVTVKISTKGVVASTVPQENFLDSTFCFLKSFFHLFVAQVIKRLNALMPNFVGSSNRVRNLVLAEAPFAQQSDAGLLRERLIRLIIRNHGVSCDILLLALLTLPT